MTFPGATRLVRAGAAVLSALAAATVVSAVVRRGRGARSPGARSPTTPPAGPVLTADPTLTASREPAQAAAAAPIIRPEADPATSRAGTSAAPAAVGPSASPAVVTAPAGPASGDSGEPAVFEPLPNRFPRSAWLVVYLVAILGPFVAVLATNDLEPRPFAFELGSALGISALSVLALQLVLPARLSILAPLGADVAVRLHRRVADVLAALIVAHVTVVMIADPGRLGLLTFFGAPWRAQAAMGSVIAVAALIATSVRRRGARLSYAGWRGIHAVLGIAALVLAVIHTVGVGRYLARGVPEAILAILTAIGIGGVVILRLPRAGGARLRPYTVTGIVHEQGGATTLQLAADGHDGQGFSPGQFAWLKLPGMRSTLAEHPFSYSSSALRPGHPEFTIQPYDGFSRAVASFAPGTRLLVDGPHGSFRFASDAAGCLLIAGGIGITPSMSILRTAAELGDDRPFVLVYAAKSQDRIVFRDELETIRRRIHLTLVPVLSAAGTGWTGDRGRVSRELLDRILPRDLRLWQLLVCGPPAFVDAAMAVLADIGIPPERVHAERFVTV